MAVPAQQTLMTAEELFELPNDDYKYELVQGELIRMAPTGGEHGVLTVRIGRILDEYVEAHDLGICSGAETGFILQRNPDIVRAPDAAFIAKARIPETGIPADECAGDSGHCTPYTTAETPPSILIAVPVMKAAWSDTRKATSAPTSSGWPRRLSGTFWAILSLNSSSVPVDPIRCQ